MGESKDIQKRPRAARLRSNLTSRNQGNSEVVLWISRVRYVTRGFATHIRAEIVHKGWNACVDRCRVNDILDSMLFGRCLPRLHIFIRCFTFFFPRIFPFTFGGAVRFERFKAMDRSRKKKTSVETRRNRGFKGLEETLSGCKIARRTVYNPSAYFSAAAWLDRRASSRNRPIMRTRLSDCEKKN